MDNKFVKQVKRMLNPIDVGAMHLIQKLNGSLPVKIQKKLIKGTADKFPNMAFVVEPYSYFLCYELTNLEKAKDYLPDGFKLAKSKIFENDEEKYYGIFGVFNANTSGFFGLRVEFYIIAENQHTGLLSWIIVDYDTNTISYDPKFGLRSANASDSLFTIDYDGIIHADVNNNNHIRKLIFNSNIKGGQLKKLSQRLWIEGNLSIAYSKLLSDSVENMSLKFNPDEFRQALDIPLSDLEVISNNWFKDIINDKVDAALCFPYAQHFLSDSPLAFSDIRTEEEMENAIKTIDLDNLKSFSSKPIVKMMKIGFIISMITTLILLHFAIT